MTKETFLDSAKQCCENGRRLLAEAQLLEYELPAATRCYLSIIAQEEVAKAFLLYLVAIESIPWTPLLWRATRDHQCKHLVGLVIDYMSQDSDEFFRSLLVAVQQKKQLLLPPEVVDAMNILRHEKIRGWEPNPGMWEEEPLYDKTASEVADGQRDKHKQRALYVELTRTGTVNISPERITVDQANDEYERGQRFEQCVRGLTDGKTGSAYDYARVKDCFEVLFSEPLRFITYQFS